MSKEYLEALGTFNYIMTRCKEEDSYVIKFPLGIQKETTFGEDMEKAYEVIKQALIQGEQDKKKATCWDIVVKKNVDVGLIKKLGSAGQYNSHKWDWMPNLTEEEFDTLKRC